MKRPPARGTTAGGTALFLWWQRRLARQGRTPLLDLTLFRHRPYAMGTVVAFIYGTALFGSTYLLPVYMQMGLHIAPAHVGSILLPAGIVLAITIPLAGRLAEEHGLPVLDGVSCAVRLAEAMVGLGLRTSRLGGYAPPRFQKLRATA